MRAMRAPRTTAAALGAAAIAAAAVPVAGAADATPVAHAARRATVSLKHDRFHPRTLHVRKGATVTWRWRDHGTAHNVTFRSFHSSTKTHGRFRHRFRSAGTFRYRCTIHPGMTGKIVVG